MLSGLPPDISNFEDVSQAIDRLGSQFPLQYGFKAYRNAAFNVMDGTQLQYDTRAYDPDSLWDLSQYWFKAPVDGLYSFEAQYTMAGAPGAVDTYYEVRFYKNGTGGTFYEGPRFPNRGYSIIVSAPLYVKLIKGDTIQAHASIGAAIASSALSVGETYTWIAGGLVRF